MVYHIGCTILVVKLNSMLRSSLCDYSDAYIPVSGTMKAKAQARDNPNYVNKK